MKNKDRLSCLPDEILSHILSLMPTKFAVRTCILSKRWKYSWTLVTNLDFHVHSPRFKGFSTFVNRVLKHCKTSQLNSFRLDTYHSSMLLRTSDVSKWINEAIRLNVCELDIHVWQVALPRSLFTSKTLTKLKLVVSLHDSDVFNVSSPVLLPSMKILDLYVCNQSLVNVFKFILGCIVLESLSLEVEVPTTKEEYNFNSHTLKRLELKIESSSTKSKVALNVPNLEYLYVRGGLCKRFLMQDVSSLVEANVLFNSAKCHHKKAKFLRGLSGVISLSLSTSTPQEFVHSPLPKFPNLKHLDWKGSSKSPWFLVIRILESSSELEHFCFEEPEDISWTEPQSVPICLLTNLKTMKITKCKGDTQFLEYILGNAAVLETLTIICGSLVMKEEMKLCARLLKFRRASSFCEINLVGKCVNSIDD